MQLGEVTDNEAKSRFELGVEGGLAVAMYERPGQTITFTHTVVPRQAQGHGVGQRLAAAALDSVLEQHLTVVPQCKFIAAFIEQHPEYQSLVAN